ncbi:N-acyl homoserine lactonase family protein [Colwelliaceae bacterium 6441]
MFKSTKGLVISHMKQIKLLLISFIFLAPFAFAEKANDEPNIKLYTIDCGTLDVADIAVLSSTGEYDGQQLKMANPCFLIRHPQGDLLWETGHIDSLADNREGEVSGVWHSKRSTKLIEQLALLQVKPQDIEYLALSHVHPDHAGNANKFSYSTFIVNALEREYMFLAQTKTYFGAFYQELESAKTIVFNTEHDVFNDGSVIIHSMPGHTPGSSTLLVRLKESGNILLSGDLYIHARGRELNTMHQYNVDKKLTLTSRSKFEALAKREKAKVVIQHEHADFKRLPKFPHFLD